MVKILPEKIKPFFNSPDWGNPKFVFSQIVIFYFLFVFIRFIIYSLFIEVSGMGDDYTYKGMALSFFEYKDFYKINYIRNFPLPNYLYPLVISPVFIFGEHFYIFTKLVNSLLINLSIFPVFLLAREFMHNKRAFLTSLMVLLLPFLNIGKSFMTETLYLPLFLFGFYFIYKLLTCWQSKYIILSGLTLAFLYLTKPHALYLVSAFILTTLVIVSMIRNTIPWKRIIILSVATLSLSFFIVIVMNMIFVGKPQLSFMFYKGIPGNHLDMVQKFKFLTLFSLKSFYLILSHISIFWILYLIPFFISIVSLISAFKNKNTKKIIFLTLGLMFSIIIFLVIFSLNTPNFIDKNIKLQARYYFMIFPFYLIVFSAFFQKIDWKNTLKILISSLFVLSVLFNLFILIPKVLLSKKGFGVMAYISATWIYQSQAKWGLMGDVLFLLVMLGSFMILVYYLFRKGTKIYPFLIFFIFLTLISHFGLLSRIEKNNDRFLHFRNKYFYFVQEKIPRSSKRVARVGREFFPIGYRAYWGYFGFWFHFDFTYYIKYKRGVTITLTRKMIPKKTRWILIEGDHIIKFPVKKLYRKGIYTIAQVY